MDDQIAHLNALITDLFQRVGKAGRACCKSDRIVCFNEAPSVMTGKDRNIGAVRWTFCGFNEAPSVMTGKVVVGVVFPKSRDSFNEAPSVMTGKDEAKAVRVP